MRSTLRRHGSTRSGGMNFPYLKKWGTVKSDLVPNEKTLHFLLPLASAIFGLPGPMVFRTAK